MVDIFLAEYLNQLQVHSRNIVILAFLFPQHKVEGLLNSWPWGNCHHYWICLFRNPSCHWKKNVFLLYRSDGSYISITGRNFRPAQNRNFKMQNYGRFWSYREIRPPNESSPRALSNGHGFRGPCFQGVPNLGRLVHPLPAVWTVFVGFHETVKG